MPSFTNIVINDGESTPVAHTFKPNGFADQQTVANWKESTGVPIGDSRLSMSLRSTGSKQKVRMKLDVPVVVTETINGVSNPVIARTAYADLTLTFDDKSTTQERDNVLTMLANLLGNATAIAVAQDLEMVY